MEYFEQLPHPALEPYVQCYWALRGSGADAGVQRVLPDGCCELIFHCGDEFSQAHAEARVLQPRALFVGPTGRSILIIPGERIDVVAIRFRAGGAGLVLRQPLAEVRDVAASCEDLGLRFGLDLIDALTPLPTRSRIRLLEHLLLTELKRDSWADATVWRARSLIVSSGGRLDIDAVARASEVTPRQLQRRFETVVGLTPKQFARLVRLQLAVSTATEEGASLARVAALAGYSDQSHFTREFRAIAGVTPAAYFRQTHSLNELFYATAEGGPLSD